MVLVTRMSVFVCAVANRAGTHERLAGPAGEHDHAGAALEEVGHGLFW